MTTPELRRVFSMFDRNDDGKISRKELSDLLQKLGIHIQADELLEMIEKIDGDGYMDANEFAELYAAVMESGDRCGGDEDDDIWEAFRVFDRNGDGFITVEELRSVLASLGLKQGRTLEDCQRMIVKVDADNDGKVKFDEFRQMMKRGGLRRWVDGRIGAMAMMGKAMAGFQSYEVQKRGSITLWNTKKTL